MHSAGRPRRGTRARGSVSGQRSPMRARSSREGTTRSERQWLRLPTSMYSMKRTITPLPRKRSTSSSTVWSLTPRCTTALILMGASSARRACSMPSSTSVRPAKPPLMRANTCRVEAVEAHRDALEPRRLELGGVARQQHAVGGESHVFDAGDVGQIADEIGQIGTQQRLAAGQAQLAYAELHEQPRQAHDLIERQPLVRSEEAVALMVGLARHAVRAAEVAAVHHRDAQVAHRARQRIARRGQRIQGNDDFAAGHGAPSMGTGPGKWLSAEGGGGCGVRRGRTAAWKWLTTSDKAASRSPWRRYWARAAARRSLRYRRAP